jgi:hypothetical protein
MNHLFSYNNSYGERMYIVVVGAKSIRQARAAISFPVTFRGKTDISCSNNVYDADIFRAPSVYIGTYTFLESDGRGGRG